METTVESTEFGPRGANAPLSVGLLGPIAVARGGVELALPPSRKARALLAYLALAPRPVGRDRLCELLWDVPDDPRGELRWCLSKLRALLDDPDRRRIVTEGDTVLLDAGEGVIDALAVGAAAERGLQGLDAAALGRLLDLYRGPFADGLELERSPHFHAWLTAQRRRFGAFKVALLERLTASLAPGDPALLPALEAWVAEAPFDRRAHLALLDALDAAGRRADCEAHLDAAARLFADEDLDFAPLRAAWQQLRARPAGVAPVPAAPVPAEPARPPAASEATGAAAGARRASLAVMPFLELTAEGPARGGLGDGLTHDIITRLAKLRMLFVIARGSVFALAERGVGPEDAGRRLDVDYVACGTVRRRAGRIAVAVEVIEARSARIVWDESFEERLDGALDVLEVIGDRIVAAIASEIETVERNRAVLKPPASLDAWEAYHRGLWHMYRFTKPENDKARHFFEMATRLDPTFARAHAGLSFTHWQSAFQRWGDRAGDGDLAFEAAGHSLMADDHDPAAHWAMGRALWLRDRADEALVELGAAVALSPNFALGHYALSFVNSQSGDAEAAIRSSDQSRHLSPFDPLLFGMLGTRALAHARRGEYAEAASWAVKAAARPNAHAAILAIAALCLALAGEVDEGRAVAAALHQRVPGYSVADFLDTFRFPPETEALFRRHAGQVGLG